MIAKLKPQHKRVLTKVGTFVLLPGLVVLYVDQLHSRILAYVRDNKTTLSDELEAAKPSTADDALRPQNAILASAEVQALWQGKDAPSVAPSPADKPAQTSAGETSGGLISQADKESLWASETPVPLASPHAAVEARSAAPVPTVSGPVSMPQSAPTEGPNERAKDVSPPAQTSLHSQEGTTEVTPEEAVLTALAQKPSHAVQTGSGNTVPEAQVQRSAQVYRSAFGTTSAGGQPAARSPSQKVAHAGGDVQAYLGWSQGSGERNRLVGNAPKALAGKSVLKAGQSILAVLNHTLVVGSKPVKAVFYSIGPLNKVSNVPDGMTLMGEATLAADRRRAFIEITTCANENTEAASLPCKAVVRGIGGSDDGGEGLTGYFYSPQVWKAAIDGVSAWLSTATLNRLTQSYDSLGRQGLDQAQAANVYGALAQSFQRVSEGFKESLPSSELRIAQGAIVDILVTESTELW